MEKGTKQKDSDWKKRKNWDTKIWGKLGVKKIGKRKRWRSNEDQHMRKTICLIFSGLLNTRTWWPHRSCFCPSWRPGTGARAGWTTGTRSGSHYPRKCTCKIWYLQNRCKCVPIILSVVCPKENSTIKPTIISLWHFFIANLMTLVRTWYVLVPNRFTGSNRFNTGSIIGKSSHTYSITGLGLRMFKF